MKIVVDAMGGDNAPMEIVRGALEAAAEQDVNIILTGMGAEILGCLDALGYKDLPRNVEIGNASQIITMEDEPVLAARSKRDSSMTVALKMLRDGGADAMVSAGSTGALLAGATLLLGRMKGVRRAALAPILPSTSGGVLLVDSGGTSQCTAEYLVQYARMGVIYARKAMRLGQPRVGLLNMGTEADKGPDVQKAAYQLLMEEHAAGRMDFVGNVEASGALLGDCDVLVSDGMSGNVMLKTVEGMGKLVLTRLRELSGQSGRGKMAVRLGERVLGEVEAQFDAAVVGGSLLLGVLKPVVKAHGASEGESVKNAIAQAVLMVKSGICGDMLQALGEETQYGI